MKVLKNTVWIPLALIFSLQFSFAQPSKIDSLLTIIKTAKEDTNKVNALNAVSGQLLQKGDYDTAFIHAEHAKKLAEKINFKKGVGKAYNNIAVIYQNQGNYSEALKNHFASLKIKEEIGDKQGIGYTYNGIGRVYTNQGNYAEALKNYFACLKIMEETGDKKGIATSYNNIGNVNHYQGNYPDALKNYYAALKIREEIGDKQGIATSYNNIGLIYTAQGNLPEALETHFSSLKIAEEIGDKKGVANSYTSIGTIYKSQGNYQEALRNQLASLKIRKEIGDKNGIGLSYHNIGSLYAIQGNYPEALKNYFACLKITEEIGDKQGVASAYNNIGKIFTRQKKYAEAEEALNNGKDISQKINNKEHLRESYLGLAELDSARGNYQQAFAFYKLYILYKDSMMNEENNKQIAQLKIIYETEKKQAEIEKKQKEHDLEMAVASEKAKGQRTFWVTVSLLIIGISFLSFFFYRKRKNYLFRQQVSELKHKALSTQISHHFITNTITTIINFIENNNKQEATKYLSWFERLIQDVLDSSYKKLIPLKKDLEILETYIHLQKLQFGEGKLDCEIITDKTIDVENFFVSPMLLQIFVENSIEHGFIPKEGEWKLKVAIDNMQDRLKCSIEDNGIGVSASQKLKTGNDKSFGMKLANEVLNNITVHTLYDNNNAIRGTRVEFSIPCTIHKP